MVIDVTPFTIYVLFKCAISVVYSLIFFHFVYFLGQKKQEDILKRIENNIGFHVSRVYSICVLCLSSSTKGDKYEKGDPLLMQILHLSSALAVLTILTGFLEHYPAFCLQITVRLGM